MNLITCQHVWVEQCLARYKNESPEGYHWEDAHYPIPRCQNGLETVRLWYPDHVIHGALQTLNLLHPCMHHKRISKEREIVGTIYPEYLELYEEAVRFFRTYAGKKGGQIGGKIGGKISGKINGARARDQGKGMFSLSAKERREIASRVGKKVKELGIGIFGISPEKRSELSSRNGKKNKELGRGIFGLSPEERSKFSKESGKIGGQRTKELGVGIFGLTFEEKSLIAKKVNSQRWKSTVDGFESNAGGVAAHNMRRGWDPNARVRLE